MTAPMSDAATPSEYLVLSRGQWDPSIPPEEIQGAIDRFYVWLDRLVEEGKMKTGQRLASRSAHAHPTLPEALKEAALAVDGRPLNA